MKKLSLILCCVCLLAVNTRAEIPEGWSVNYTNTVTAATNSQSSTLLFFTASWCGPCKMMTHTTLAEPGIQDFLSRVPHVAVDIDENPVVAGRYNIQAVPTFVMLSGNGDEAARRTGFLTSADFLPWLTNSVTLSKEAMAHDALMQEKFAEIHRLMLSSNANDSTKAVETLFNLCAERDTRIIERAQNELKTLAATKPADVLEGLKHPSLSARIQAANTLRARLGKEFDIDPWSSATTRASEVDAWRKRLAATGA